MKSLLVFIIVLFLGISTLPALSNAQELGRYNDSDVSLIVEPENPGPNESVTFRIESYVIDVSRTENTWTVNGIQVKKGIGQTTTTIQTKDSGTVTTVSVSINIGGSILKKTKTLRPASVDILFESADGYVPPFYKGRVLPTSESKIRVVALPEISKNTSITPGNFTYTWSLSDAIKKSASGYGKNSFVYQSSYLRPNESVFVSIKNVDGTYTTSREFNIPWFNPEILLYEQSPLRGPRYEKELGSTLVLAGEEKTILVEPYFFTVGGGTSSYLQYKWKINQNPVTTPSKKNQLTVKSGVEKGESKVSIEIINITKFFEEATRLLTVNLQ